MIKKIARHRLVGLLSLASLAFAAGGFFWALAALGGISGPLVLHFSDLRGITSTGGIEDIVLMGILGIAIVAVNFFVALELEARDGVLGKIVAAMTLIFAILLFFGLSRL